MKKKNIIFCITIVLFAIFIALFNITVDPFQLKKCPDYNLLIKVYPRDLFYTIIKLNKNKKYDYVISGGSSSSYLFYFNVKNKSVANIASHGLFLEDIKDFLFQFLDYHPEVKTVIFPIEYQFFFMPYREKNSGLQNKPSKDLNFNDYVNLLFNYNVIKESILATFKKSIPPEEKYKERLYRREIYPALRHHFIFRTKGRKIHQQFFNPIFENLKDRNVQMVCFIPPYHAFYNAKMYNSKHYKDYEDLKRYIVKQNKVLYDFNVVNQYTSKSLFESNALFDDMLHPRPEFGIIIYDILVNNNTKPYQNMHLYYKITQDNIEQVLKKQRKEIEEYIEIHKEDIKKHEDYDNIEDFDCYKYFYKCDYYKDVPSEMREIFNNLIKKI